LVAEQNKPVTEMTRFRGEKSDAEKNNRGNTPEIELEALARRKISLIWMNEYTRDPAVRSQRA
jgi:hypothetical protein